MAPKAPVRAPSLADKYVAKDFFTYGIAITSSLAPAAQAPANFTLNADSDFLWQKASIASVTGGFLDQLPNLTILITDTATGRQLSNVALPVANSFGSGQLPFILPQPKVFQARSSVQVTVVNIDGATTYTSIYLSFIGTKLFLR